MKMFRSALGYAALAIGMLLGAVGFASATERMVSYHLRTAVATLGGYGESIAKFKAEATYMAGADEQVATRTCSLTKQSNGFIQKALASVGLDNARIGVGNGLTV